MARNYKSEIQTWEAANAYLGTRAERPLPHCANLRLERTPWDGDAKNPPIVVRLHGHTIVRFPGPGVATEYPYRGQFENSPTTKRHRSAFGGPWRV